MILFLFILGILAITAIARYNEDDRLFWKLLLSFVFAFSVTTVTYKILGAKDKNTINTQMYPTQESIHTLDLQSSFINELNLTTVLNENLIVPVGKDYTCENSYGYSIFDEIYGRNRDQPPQLVINNLNNKPRDCLTTIYCIDSS